MPAYLVSFRLEWGENYTDRWSSVVGAIRSHAIGKTWEELTSVIVFRSQKTAEEIATSVYLYSSLNAGKDTLLVVNIDDSTYATRGKVNDMTTLQSLLGKGTAVNALLGFGT